MDDSLLSPALLRRSLGCFPGCVRASVEDAYVDHTYVWRRTQCAEMVSNALGNIWSGTMGPMGWNSSRWCARWEESLALAWRVGYYPRCWYRHDTLANIDKIPCHLRACECSGLGQYCYHSGKSLRARCEWAWQSLSELGAQLEWLERGSLLAWTHMPRSDLCRVFVVVQR